MKPITEIDKKNAKKRFINLLNNNDYETIHYYVRVF